MSKAYLIFGIQGSGKGTQARLLSKNLNLPYFEAGQQLRNLANSNTEDAAAIQEVMRTGSLVPNIFLKKLFINFVNSNDCTHGLVIDGFPRNSVQSELLKELSEHFNWKVYIIHINLSKESALKRLLNRTQNIDGKVVKRADDKPEIIERRFTTYFNQTLPMIKEMENSYTTIEIDGEPDIETVAQSIRDAING